MQRRPIPTDPYPVRHDELSEDESIIVDAVTVVTDIVPQLLTSGIVLNRYPKFKAKMKSIKLEANEKKFLTDLEVESLIQFVKSDESLSMTEVCVIILDQIERYFLVRHAGENKKRLAIKLLSPLFNDDIKMCSEFIELVMPHVVRLNAINIFALRVYRRFKKR